MKPVFQSNVAAEQGDCLNACLASLLEIPLEHVPMFNMERDNGVWWHLVQEFLKSWGYQMVMIKLTEHTPWYAMPHSPFAIFIGVTKTSQLMHAVVGRVNANYGTDDHVEFELLHDPSEGASGDLDIDHICFLVPIDPRRSLPMSVLARNATVDVQEKQEPSLN